MPCSKKVKLWRNEDMEAAMSAVEGGMSRRAAAQHYNIPRTTLLDRLSGRVQHGYRSGPDTFLTSDQEQQLAAYLVDMSKQGYGKSKEIIIYMATSIAKRNGKIIKGGSLSKKWTLVTRGAIELFYSRLLEALTSQGSLLESPAQIFNCDESGFEFDAINKIVAAARGAKHVPRVSKGQHEKVTVLACASACGDTIPPLFIFKNKSGRVPQSVKEDAPPGTLFASQKSGWIDKDIYLKWFLQLFLPSAPKERPIILVVDGHKSHVTEELINAAVANNVIVFCLPAHASHLLQPLDLSLFGPLKKGWVKACAAFNHVASVVVSQRNFAKIFKIAWQTSVTPEIIRSGFRRSGIYPYDPSMFNYSRLAPSITGSSAPTTASSSTPINTMPVNSESVPVPPSPITITLIHRCSDTSPAASSDNIDSHPAPFHTQVLPAANVIQQLPVSPSASICHQTPAAPVTPACTSPSEASIQVTDSLLNLTNLEKILGKEQRDKFRKRIENGYDLANDSLYNTWRDLFFAAGGSAENESGCPCNGACCCTCKGLGYCDCIASTDMVMYSPDQSHQQQPAPLHQISTPQGQITLDPDLCDIMLLPKKQVSKKRKQRNKDLDPGNKCITGTTFLNALRSERERKEREAKEKEEKKLEKQNKAKEKREQKANKAEERKAQREKKAEEKRLTQERRQKSKRRKRKKTIVDIYEEKENYSCAKCGKHYEEEEEVTWVECDYCSDWLHFTCTNLPVLDNLGDDIVYTCEKCVKEGYPSHND
ncbi:Jerky protein [Exaiptasia diaphana]|nr:Jerky protein [Exaiptasia diaphana]